ncbi:MAG: hypothetical protein KDA24_06655 [Deltaproteobacteria bacterium]|nr:hypothetical protein [Deltaproteobacteria bacterium]
MRLSFALTALLLTAGCGADSGHGHEHGDHGHGDHHGSEAAEAPATPAEKAAEAKSAPAEKAAEAKSAPLAGTQTAVDVPLGAWTGRLVASTTGLDLSISNSDGTPMIPTGEVRVVLTGVGEEAQRIVLLPDGASWKAPASVTGAAGYTAVVSMEVGGHTESGRATWGDVPPPKTAPAKDDHAHAKDDHAHGDAGHNH